MLRQARLAAMNRDRLFIQHIHIGAIGELHHHIAIFTADIEDAIQPFILMPPGRLDRRVGHQQRELAVHQDRVFL